MNLSHQVRRAPDGVHVLLSGEIDLSVADDLRSVLRAAIADSVMTELDLHEVTYLDCASIGEIVRACLDARRQGRSLAVTGPQGFVRELLDLTNVLPLLAPHLTGAPPQPNTARRFLPDAAG